LLSHAILQFAFAALACAIVLFTLVHTGVSRVLLDQPDRANAMHVAPTPRIGGIAIVIATAAVIVFTASPNPLQLTLTIAIALAGISLIDDRFHLSALPRLIWHLLAAFAMVWLLAFESSWPQELRAHIGIQTVALLATALTITWSTNLYNFMDGADGLAGGMALFGFGAYAIAASHAPGNVDQATTMAGISAILSGAALGFLFFNFPPAKVFMGDAGSIPLGFLAAALGLHGVLWNLWDWWFPLLVFSPFIVDSTVTLLKRIVRFEKIWEAHREHYYHRLILGGWSHRRTALSYYVLMVLCAGSALYARTLAKPLLVIAFWVVTYLLLLLALERRFKGQNKNQ
jgi:UDP-N-acetylmuramyl pentapeptide phosphotransferase/UDP-N-acetylglucosamine-1-phosphate transferase